MAHVTIEPTPQQVREMIEEDTRQLRYALHDLTLRLAQRSEARNTPATTPYTAEKAIMNLGGIGRGNAMETA